MNGILDPKQREELLIVLAAVFAHGLLASAPVGATYQNVVENAFTLAKEFLKAGAAVKP